MPWKKNVKMLDTPLAGEDFEVFYAVYEITCLDHYVSSTELFIK